MRPDHKPPSNPVADGPVTAENWPGRCRDFIRARGAGFVIRLDECKSAYAKDYPITPAQWRAWMFYLGDRKIPTSFVRSHGLMTVPAEWPEDFDPMAPPSRKDWRPEPKRDGSVLGRSPRIIAAFEALLKQMGAVEKPRRPQESPESVKQKAEQHLVELKAKYASHPIEDCSALIREFER